VSPENTSPCVVISLLLVFHFLRMALQVEVNKLVEHKEPVFIDINPVKHFLGSYFEFLICHINGYFWFF
jgi:hypothetical protein